MIFLFLLIIVGGVIGFVEGMFRTKDYFSKFCQLLGIFFSTTLGVALGILIFLILYPCTNRVVESEQVNLNAINYTFTETGEEKILNYDGKEYKIESITYANEDGNDSYIEVITKKNVFNDEFYFCKLYLGKNYQELPIKSIGCNRSKSKK